jgi:hypothetical protein
MYFSGIGNKAEVTITRSVVARNGEAFGAVLLEQATGRWAKLAFDAQRRLAIGDHDELRSTHTGLSDLFEAFLGPGHEGVLGENGRESNPQSHGPCDMGTLVALTKQ